MNRRVRKIQTPPALGEGSDRRSGAQFTKKRRVRNSAPEKGLKKQKRNDGTASGGFGKKISNASVKSRNAPQLNDSKYGESFSKLGKRKRSSGLKDEVEEIYQSKDEESNSDDSEDDKVLGTDEDASENDDFSICSDDDFEDVANKLSNKNKIDPKDKSKKSISKDENTAEIPDDNMNTIGELFSSDEESSSSDISDATGQHLGKPKKKEAARVTRLEDVDEVDYDDEFSLGENEDVDEKIEGDDDNIQININSRKDFSLLTDEEREREKQHPPDLSYVNHRVQELVKVLSDFKNLHEPGRKREEYIKQLRLDLCLYYGYSEFLMARYIGMFSVTELLAFLDANETSRPVTIRTNTLKTSRRDLITALSSRGISLEPVGKWSKVGLQVFESPIAVGATPEYLAGHYMLQAAASMLPVIALAPQENERVLDMASAPGGKSSYIASLMKNTGILFANDFKKDRTKALVANLARLGVRNSIICNYDGRKFPTVISGFDRVLLDAPCSGTGVASKDPRVKISRTEMDVHNATRLQKELILAAIDSVDANSATGGVIVYSTCSVLINENEDVVDYALRKRPNVKLVDTGLGFGVEGLKNFRGRCFDKSMSLTRRFYPHVHNLDGFFVAKFKKISGKYPNQKQTGIKNGSKLIVGNPEK